MPSPGDQIMQLLRQVFMLAAVATVFSMQAVANDTLEEAISSTNRSFEKAFAQGSAKDIARLYTLDGVLIPQGSAPIVGREAIEAYWGKALGSPGQLTLKLTSTSVEQHGDVAVEIGIASIRAPDDTEIARSNYTVVWKRVGADWQLHVDMINDAAAE